MLTPADSAPPHQPLPRASGWDDFTGGLLGGLWGVSWLTILLPLAFLSLETLSAAGSEISTLWSAPSVRAALEESLSPLARLAWNTLVVSGVTAAVTLLISLPLAILLARTNLPKKRLIVAVLLLAAATPLYVTSTGWIHLVTLSRLIADWSVRNTTSTPLSATARQLFSCGAIMGIAFSPFGTLLLSAGFLAVPRDEEESALLHGSVGQVFRYVTLPLAGWSVGGTLLLATLWAAGEITVVDALWTRTYSEEIFQSFHLNWSAGRAMLTALPMVIVSLLGSAYLSRFVRRWTATPLERLVESARVYPLKKRGESGRIWQVALITIFLGGLFFLYLYPLFDLQRLGFAYRQPTNTAAIISPATTQVFAESTEAPPLWRQATDALGIGGTSFVLALLGASLALFLALPLAWFLRTSKRVRLRKIIWGSVLFLLATPTTIQGMALLNFWNNGFWSQEWLHGVGVQVPRLLADTPLIIILLYCSRSLPLTTLILWSAFRQIPEVLIDTARIEGADTLALLRRVALPLARRGMVAAGLLAYILSLSEVGGAIVVQIPGVELFSIRFATQIHFGVYPDLARLAMLPALLSCLPALLGWWFFWQKPAKIPLPKQYSEKPIREKS